MGERPWVSVVVPAYNEGEDIVPVLNRLFDAVPLPCEVLIVVDDERDSTVPVVTGYGEKEPRLRCVVNTYGRGPANAIRYGIDVAAAPVAVVTMADGCDDPRQIEELARLVDRGVAVAAASRYMAGGQRVGGPFLKGTLSMLAGRSLYALARTGTQDATNSLRPTQRSSSARSASTRAPGSRSASSSPLRRGGCGCRSPRSRPSGSTARRECRTSRSPSGYRGTCGGTGSRSVAG
ncbi:MAG TPA: glycosyltransferase family 2 protein [Trebonia sp.]